MKCGCKIIFNLGIRFCPLHAASRANARSIETMLIEISAILVAPCSDQQIR